MSGQRIGIDNDYIILLYLYIPTTQNYRRPRVHIFFLNNNDNKFK